MPLIEIRILEGRTEEQKEALMTEVTKAVHESIKAPLSTIRVWIHELAPEHYMVAGRLKTKT
ncbi:MAG: 2-hydroxymuconate tautomerase family protein [Candidatus Aminicenantes bacterium]|nr:2-hydroxymuconate tautomerase family protein [Candidatus Aminicenantes bacterium]